MGSGRREARERRSRASILLALWTLIAVTLLSALAPLGPPQSRSRGSAFNPATAEVVLKTRPALKAATTPLARPDGNDVPAAVVVIAILMLAVAQLRSVQPLNGLTITAKLHTSGSSRARAPPILL